MTSLREQKKRETARSLSHSAYRLACTQGFESLTTETIAADAGVSRRTFSNYYANKHAAVVDGFAHELGIPAGVSHDPNQVPPLPATFTELIDATEVFIIELFTSTTKIGHIQQFAKMVQDHPALEPYVHAMFLEFEHSPTHSALTRMHGKTKVSIFVGAAMGTFSSIIRMILGPLAVPRDTPPLRTHSNHTLKSTHPDGPPRLDQADLQVILTYITEAFHYLRHGFVTK